LIEKRALAVCGVCGPRPQCDTSLPKPQITCSAATCVDHFRVGVGPTGSQNVLDLVRYLRHSDSRAADFIRSQPVPPHREIGMKIMGRTSCKVVYRQCRGWSSRMSTSSPNIQASHRMIPACTAVWSSISTFRRRVESTRTVAVLRQTSAVLEDGAPMGWAASEAARVWRSSPTRWRSGQRIGDVM
jgi:hypothetical protein